MRTHINGTTISQHKPVLSLLYKWNLLINKALTVDANVE